ncbi:MAG TPA: Uma2 family endonuclease [Thermoanaerobaculia bacterium]
MAEPAKRGPALSPSDFGVPEDDPFVFGWRLQCVPLPGGGFEDREIPLTAEALVDPQFGDVLPQSEQHFELLKALFDMLQSRYEAEPDVLVCSDMKMLWSIPGLEEPAPDVAVIRGVRPGGKKRDSFNVVQEGTRPCLVIEVVSSKTAEHRRADYETKVKIYQRAGVPEYLILDPQPFLATPRLRLSGYRLDATGRYRPIQEDSEGRILSETTGLWFSVAPDGQRLWLVDAATGERFLTLTEEKDRANREAEARQAAEAELARLREEIARLRNGRS